jgi:hypothetical protein
MYCRKHRCWRVISEMYSWAVACFRNFPDGTGNRGLRPQRARSHYRFRRIFINTYKNVKVKLSRYRPGGALGVPKGCDSRISRQSAHEGGKVVSPTHRPSLLPGRIPGTHFCYRLSRPLGHNATGRIKSLKNSSDSIMNRTRELPVY